MKPNHPEIRTIPRPLCYLCGSRGECLYEDLRDHLFGVAGTWNYRRCPSPQCGLVWLDPMPIEEDVSMLYERYFTHTPGVSAAASGARSFLDSVASGLLAKTFGYREQSTQFGAGSLARLAARSRFLRECIGMSVSWLHGVEGGRLIDVGSGNGQFLAHMRELGWDVVGVEPDPQAAQMGRQTYGLKVYTGVLEQADLAPGSFDAMTMTHVMEHLVDPARTLRTARKLLRKGGRLVILTPNITSLGHRWFRQHWRGLEPPRHLFLFSSNSLRKMVETGGFEVLESRKNAVAADSIWRLSRAAEQGLTLHDLPKGYARVTGGVFMLLEHVLTGRPFRRAWGEQLALIAS